MMVVYWLLDVQITFSKNLKRGQVKLGTTLSSRATRIPDNVGGGR
jgi:hypothetical protein